MKARKSRKKVIVAKRRIRRLIPSARELAEMLGGNLAKRLTPKQISRLRKPLPGYVSLLDDAARQLEEDGDLLNLPDVTPEELFEMHARHKYLSVRETVAETVYRSFYEQRLLVDDRAMAMMQKLARRIEAMKEDDPDLPARWRFLREFLAQFRGGGRPPKGNAGSSSPPTPMTSI